MAAIINTVYPSYNNVSNYSGVNSAIRSAGVVRNIDQQQAILGLEREGRLGLSQFGLIKLPRDVLMLQDEREAKVRTTRQGDQVTSSSQSDLDEERDLNRVDDRGDSILRVDAAKARRQKPSDSPRDENAALQADAQKQNTRQAGEQADAKTTRKPDGAFGQEFGSLFAKPADAKSEAPAQTRKREEGRATRPSVTGSPNSIYATIQSNSQAALPAQAAEKPFLNVLA